MRMRQVAGVMMVVAIVVYAGCGEPLPPIAGYSQPNEVEAKQFAEACAQDIAHGRFDALTEKYDALYFVHHVSGTYNGTAFSQLTKAQYEDFNAFSREVISRRIGGMFPSGGACRVKSIEASDGLRRATLEATGQLAGSSMPVLIELDIVKNDRGELVLCNLSDRPARRH